MEKIPQRLSLALISLSRRATGGFSKRISSYPLPSVADSRPRFYSSYLGAKLYNPEKTIDYEVSQNPEEWKYVDRLQPPKHIPVPTQKDSYPSGWTPPRELSLSLPYFVRRSRNHMLPVYLDISYRGVRRLTLVRHIRGDIWLFADHIKGYLESKDGRDVGIRIDEVGGKVTLKGDYVNLVKQWLLDKGF